MSLLADATDSWPDDHALALDRSVSAKCTTPRLNLSQGGIDPVLFTRVVCVTAHSDDASTRLLCTLDGSVPGLDCNDKGCQEFPNFGLVCKRVGTYYISVRAFRDGFEPSDTVTSVVTVARDESRAGGVVEAHPVIIPELHAAGDLPESSEVDQICRD